MPILKASHSLFNVPDRQRLLWCPNPDTFRLWRFDVNFKRILDGDQPCIVAHFLGRWIKTTGKLPDFRIGIPARIGNGDIICSSRW